MAKKHIVKQGECLSKIAERYGFGDFRLIYDAPVNAGLRSMRPNPSLLHPGDEVMIPEVVPKAVSGQTGQSSAFVVQRPTRVLRLVMKDHMHKPMANAPFELRIKSGPAISGSTDGSGKIEEKVPAASIEADLLVAGRRYRLRFGHLNPMRSAPDQGVSGAQGRLKSLGYYSGPAHGQLDHATRIGLALFQGDFGLTADGKVNEATVSKLEQVYGS